MREHKYRAYDKEDEIMIYSDGRNKEAYPIEYEFTFNEKGCMVCKWIEDYDDIWGDSQTEYGELDNIMQYTGLNDCKRTKEYPNGEEIYEKDLLKDDEGFIWEVLPFENGKIQIYCNDLMATEDIYPRIKFCEKVGNVYTNPEMVEGAK